MSLDVKRHKLCSHSADQIWRWPIKSLSVSARMTRDHRACLSTAFNVFNQVETLVWLEDLGDIRNYYNDKTLPRNTGPWWKGGPSIKSLLYRQEWTSWREDYQSRQPLAMMCHATPSDTSFTPRVTIKLTMLSRLQSTSLQSNVPNLWVPKQTKLIAQPIPDSDRINVHVHQSFYTSNRLTSRPECQLTSSSLPMCGVLQARDQGL